MMQSEHLSKQFDADLDRLRSQVLQMGGLVESQILGAIEGFSTGNRELLDRIINNEPRVNGYEVTIDGDCSHAIVKRQPAASDLRMIMAISKTVTDLERIGDEAEKIARMSVRIHEHDRLNIQRFGEIRHVGNIAVQMLRQALDAFARLDAEQAVRVVGEDAAIDDEFGAIASDAVDLRWRRYGRHEDPGLVMKRTGGEGHGSAVIAAGSGRDAGKRDWLR